MTREETRKYINEIFDYIEKDTSEDGERIEAHPALYFFHSKEELEEKIEEFLSSKDTFDRYDIYYFTNKMIKFLLVKYDSHASIKFTIGTDFNFPLRTKIIDNKIYVVEIFKELEKYNFSEIIAINDIPIKQIIKETEDMICYSTSGWLKTKIESGIIDCGNLRSLPSIKNDEEIFKYTLVKDGKKEEIIFDSNIKYEQLRYKEKDNYTYEIKDDVLVIVYNLCRDEDKMKEFVKEIRQVAKSNNINRFVVDLRGNTGGDSNVIEPLLEFLKGKEIVTLIDGAVFSSGSLACLELKELGSYFIGTEIGTTINVFGWVPKPFIMENIGLRVIKSVCYLLFKDEYHCTFLNKNTFNNYFKSVEDFNKLNRRVFMPDLYVEKSLEDYINGRDAQLEAALECLKNNWKL